MYILIYCYKLWKKWVYFFILLICCSITLQQAFMTARWSSSLFSNSMKQNNPLQILSLNTLWNGQSLSYRQNSLLGFQSHVLAAALLEWANDNEDCFPERTAEIGRAGSQYAPIPSKLWNLINNVIVIRSVTIVETRVLPNNVDEWLNLPPRRVGKWE